jgi:hypothetical protein
MKHRELWWGVRVTEKGFLDGWVSSNGYWHTTPQLIHSRAVAKRVAKRYLSEYAKRTIKRITVEYD